MDAYISNNMTILILITIWVIPWKAYALWIASKREDKRWFIALVVLNTFAILEIIYIFYVAKKTPKDLISELKTKI